MSNETVSYSLESVLTRIESKIDFLEKRMDERFDKVDDRLTKLEIGQAELKAELKGDIKVLDEKIEGLTVRVAYQEFTNWGILIALVVAVLGGAAKLFGFFPNP
jgi:peptidoglycan hydrolase CwlO-like protein